MFCKVAAKTPFNGSILTYLEGPYSENINVGDIVEVPLGSRTIPGCILEKGLGEEEVQRDVNIEKIKEISGMEYSTISIEKTHLELFLWLSNYYHYNIGQLIFETVPKSLKRPRKLKFIAGKGKSFDFELNLDQKYAVSEISKGEGFNKWLIHGVTGSGKTAIYLELVKKVISEGKSVLFLLPEINLTPQFISKFEQHVNAPIYSYNSSISASDKYGLWKLLSQDDSPKIIIGVRSSIFLPIKKLGLIVVDEEHDQSFKQEDRCPYNARDIAIKRAQLDSFTIILGSATPSVETVYNFQKAERYLSLKKRVGPANLPKIHLIDMTETGGGDKNRFWPLSNKSIEMTEQALTKNEQVVFFVNRLGYANYLQCRACGHQFHCPNCSVNLKYFKHKDEICCNSCGYSQATPKICPECQNMNLYQKGYGTEKLHDILTQHFESSYQVERFDRDEIINFRKLEERLSAFHAGKIDVLVGTQMLSKGHNFEKVNLVVIAGVDAQLNFPDFRANERVYQLLTQVAGRSGRFGAEADVLIHTLNSENQIFRYVTDHTFDDFYKDELEIRKICRCPPFAKLAMIYLTSRFQTKVVAEALRLTDKLKQVCEKHFNQVEVVGPRPSFIEKRVNKYTWCFLVRSTDVNQLHNALNTVLNGWNSDSSVNIKVDIDPSIIM